MTSIRVAIQVLTDRGAEIDVIVEDDHVFHGELAEGMARVTKEATERAIAGAQAT